LNSRRELFATPYQSSNKAMEDTKTWAPAPVAFRNLPRTAGGFPLMSAMQALVSSK